MAEYHFVSTWQIQAPIERVWEEIYHAERWPNGDATKASTDAAPFQCTHAPLPAVVVPGA